MNEFHYFHLCIPLWSYASISEMVCHNWMGFKTEGFRNPIKGNTPFSSNSVKPKKTMLNITKTLSSYYTKISVYFHFIYSKPFCPKGTKVCSQLTKMIEFLIKPAEHWIFLILSPWCLIITEAQASPAHCSKSLLRRVSIHKSSVIVLGLNFKIYFIG